MSLSFNQCNNLHTVVPAFSLAKRMSIYPKQCKILKFSVQAVKFPVQIDAIYRVTKLFSFYTFSNQSFDC